MAKAKKEVSTSDKPVKAEYRKLDNGELSLILKHYNFGAWDDDKIQQNIVVKVNLNGKKIALPPKPPDQAPSNLGNVNRPRNAPA